MLSACVIIAQTAIFIKKKFENRRDRIAVGNIEFDGEKNNNTNCMNTQKWNPNICATPRTFLMILLVFIVHFISGNSLYSWSNLNSNEKSLLATNVYQLMFNLGVPLYMYGKNTSIFQHLIHDLLEEFLGIENIPTCFPKRTSMIYPSNQKMKISQKLQSKSEPLAHSISMSPPPCSTKKMTNKIVVSQVPQETFDKVNEEQNQNYPPNFLSYSDQKALLSAARLKNAGFQLSTDTPEDGNCLIHALKDQMR